MGEKTKMAAAHEQHSFEIALASSLDNVDLGFSFRDKQMEAHMSFLYICCFVDSPID